MGNSIGRVPRRQTTISRQLSPSLPRQLLHATTPQSVRPQLYRHWEVIRHTRQPLHGKCRKQVRTVLDRLRTPSHHRILYLLRHRRIRELDRRLARDRITCKQDRTRPMAIASGSHSTVCPPRHYIQIRRYCSIQMRHLMDNQICHMQATPVDLQPHGEQHRPVRLESHYHQRFHRTGTSHQTRLTGDPACHYLRHLRDRLQALARRV